MTTAVEQYRALVAKLEAINPSEPADQTSTGSYSAVSEQASDDETLAELTKISKNLASGSN